jgi:hypothetical protein
LRTRCAHPVVLVFSSESPILPVFPLNKLGVCSVDEANFPRTFPRSQVKAQLPDGAACLLKYDETHRVAMVRGMFTNNKGTRAERIAECVDSYQVRRAVSYQCIFRVTLRSAPDPALAAARALLRRSPPLLAAKRVCAWKGAHRLDKPFAVTHAAAPAVDAAWPAVRSGSWHSFPRRCRALAQLGGGPSAAAAACS